MADNLPVPAEWLYHKYNDTELENLCNTIHNHIAKHILHEIFIQVLHLC
jgi:hypothetical protein